MRTGESFETGEGIGITDVLSVVRGIEFPVRKAILIQNYGSVPIEHRPGETISLRDLLDGIEDEEFASLAFLLAAVKVQLRQKHGRLPDRRTQPARPEPRRASPPRPGGIKG